jgi:hypothetical protein
MFLVLTGFDKFDDKIDHDNASIELFTGRGTKQRESIII